MDGPPASSARTGSTDRRPLLVRVTAVVAVVAVISSLLFALFTIMGRPDHSPIEATRRLFEAVVANDPIAALDTITPSERAIIDARSGDLFAELERLGLLTAFDRATVPGARVTTDSLGFTTTELAPSITAVDVIAGRITLQLDVNAAPLSPIARDQLARDFDIDLTKGTYTRDFAQFPLRVVATDEGEGWHLSLAYSVAEALRGAGPPGRTPPTSLRPRAPTEPGTTTTTAPPAWGTSTAPTGAPTAEGAVRKFVQALVENDPGNAVALTVPEESRVLYDYLPLLSPAQAEPGSAVNNLNLSITGDGDTRTIRITSMEVDLIGLVQNTHVSYSGKCYQAAYRFGDLAPYIAFERCNDASFVAPAVIPVAGEDPEQEAREAEARRKALVGGGGTEVRVGESPPRDSVFNAIAVFGGGIDLPTFTVVERDGRWFISPARTIIDSTIETLRAMKPDQVGTLSDRLRRSVAPAVNPDVAREARDPDNALFGPGAAARQPLVARCFIDVLETVGEYGTATYGPACLRNLVNEGRVDAGTVEAMVLFGDCLTSQHTGPPDASNPIRRLFLSDRAVRRCLEAHVAAGEAPAAVLERMNHPSDQPCYLAYQPLAPEAPEAEWQAADAIAQQCLDEQLTR